MPLYRLFAIVLSVLLSSTAGFAAEAKPMLWTDPVMSMYGVVCSSGVVEPTFDGLDSYATALHLQVIKEEKNPPTDRHKTWVGRFKDGGAFTITAEEYIQEKWRGNICAITGVVKDPDAFRATVVKYMGLTKDPMTVPFEQTGTEYIWGPGAEFGHVFKLGIKKLAEGQYGVKVSDWDKEPR